MSRFAAPLIAVALCVGCGSASPINDIASEQPATTEPASTSSTEQPDPQPIAAIVAEVKPIGSVPFDIGPLPDGVTPELSARQVLDIVIADPIAGRFFMTAEDLATASIEVGLITDHSLLDGSDSNDPTFPGYVVTGGHSICVWSGPPSTDLSPHQTPCHTQMIVNGDTGESSRLSEIGDPLTTYRTIGSVIEGADDQAMIVFSQLDSFPPQVGHGIPVANWNWDLVDSEQSASGTTWTEQATEFVGTWDGTVFLLTEDPKPTEHPTVELGSPTPDCDQNAWLDMLSSLDTTALGIIAMSADASDGRCGVHVAALVQTPELTAALEPFGDEATVEYQLVPIES